jgi:hypothetical protein
VRTASEGESLLPVRAIDAKYTRAIVTVESRTTRQALPVMLGILTLGLVGLLLFWDAFPALFPAGAHAVLGALPLAAIALAYLVYQFIRRPTRMEMVKAAILAVAFLFWSANQLWPDLSAATLFNDIAIALFVLDVFFVIVGWPPGVPDESFAESYVAEDNPGP